MIFEIKNRFTGSVMFSLETESLKLCVEAAINSRADLSGADLSGATLSRATLYRADLSRATLYGADLYGATLSGADLSGAENAELIIARTQITPQEGSFVAWKKLSKGVIAKLVIPHDALRVNSIGSRKCRASKAFVYELFGATEAVDTYTGKLLYKQGEEVIPNKFDPSKFVECSHGIHFFMTREEAEEYQ